jgi:hypothetical protein
MTIWRTRNACCTPKATNTHTGCVILIHCFSTTTMVVGRTRLNVTLYVHCMSCFFRGANSPTQAQAVSLLRFRDHTQLDTHTHTHPVGLLWTSDQPVTESATYTTHKKHKRRTYMHSAEIEPATPTIDQPHNYALDRF